MATRFWRLVSQVTIWHIAASICYYAVYAGTPLFRDAFSLSGVSVGFVITALTLGYAIFLLPIGVVTDRFGEHRTLTVGLIGLATGALLIAIAPTYGLLLGAAFVLGSMYGTATPGTNKAIFDNIQPERQHRAIGIKQIGPTIGSAISALLVTGLVGIFFWQIGFLIAAVTGFTTAILFYVTYQGASTTVASYPNFRALIANRSYLLLVAAGVCIGAGFYTTTGYTVMYVEDSVGAAVATGGLILALLQVFSSAGKVVAGWLADVLPGDPRTRIGSILAVQTLVGGVLFFAITMLSTPIGAGVVFSAVGIFALGSTGLYYSCISTVVADDDIGAASAVGQLAATTGGLITPPVFGYLIDTVGYDAGWMLLGILSLIATGLVMVVIIVDG
ncbi:MFS transporter [Natrialba sp. SSL1]|uniref:MFS transporter n=1 Tax=Natrialba sp. SSL1 TaxID=1869245 RepID=UPI0008F80B0E|nr:MFS transporter [Natrialba sp. SSL1]OIB55286.1 MFS transporter [Natrialba sp. SSL1]